VECQGRLIQLRIIFERNLSKGMHPESDPEMSAGSEIDAFTGLKVNINARASVECPAFRNRFSAANRHDAYHMPNWTPAQWQRAQSFCSGPLDTVGLGQVSYGAPAIWDSEPIHRGCRNVVFLDGSVVRGVPENLFQRLRRESEAFVRSNNE
jgi:hypothetical protein